MRRPAVLAFIAGIISLILVNYAVFQKETLLNDGEVIYLELVPVDPRSLMQGDYMALRFAIGNQIQSALRKIQREDDESKSNDASITTYDGYVIVKLDANGVGRYSRISDHKPLNKDERKMRFRVRGDQVKFATNAFFFQEGTARLYEGARYGEFRLDNEGNMLLTELRDTRLLRLSVIN